MTTSTEKTGSATQKPSDLQSKLQADPDLVDRIFDYILAEFPAISEQVSKYKSEVRKEFAGEDCYIAGRPATARQERVGQVLALFNGRNASEVARRLQIGRATVYRVLKQSGPSKPSQFSGK
ncbi:MAG: helix-turn-helix domain-containing protein [Rhodoferax sp.]|nr:helix-turn-helix domain-containing protein [Rhodoferax sp.]MDP3651057.1 helix-turn-helix domain-containing protein [Rhodoferax sp.]